MKWSSSLGTGTGRASLSLSVVSIQPLLSPNMKPCKWVHIFCCGPALHLAAYQHVQQYQSGTVLTVLVPEHASTLLLACAHISARYELFSWHMLLLSMQIPYRVQAFYKAFNAHAPLADEQAGVLHGVHYSISQHRRH